ncbi:MAG: hypothetical protein ACTSYO_05735 [Candidatus Ranarchaeia archaeon]
MNADFEEVQERALIKSVTCVSDLDGIMHAGQVFLEKLPDAENHTTWR